MPPEDLAAQPATEVADQNPVSQLDAQNEVLKDLLAQLPLEAQDLTPSQLLYLSEAAGLEMGESYLNYSKKLIEAGVKPPTQAELAQLTDNPNQDALDNLQALVKEYGPTPNVISEAEQATLGAAQVNRESVNLRQAHLEEGLDPKDLEYLDDTAITSTVSAVDRTNIVTPPTTQRDPWQSQDNDGDGLTNREELLLGTDPNRADTDNDGVSDDVELQSGTNPNDAGESLEAIFSNYDQLVAGSQDLGQAEPERLGASFETQEAMAENLNGPKPEPSLSLEGLLGKIHQQVEANKFQANIPLTIYDGKNLVFKAEPGREPTKNTITPQQVELIQKAINDPQGLKGSIRIYVGNEKIFHNKNGEILADKLGLVPKQQPVQEASQEKKAEEANPKTIETQDHQSLEKRIDHLQDLIKQQQKQIDYLTQQVERINNLPISAVVVNEKLGNWLNDVYSKVGAVGQTAVSQMSEKMEQDKATLGNSLRQLMDRTQQKVSEAVQSTQHKVANTMHSARDAVQSKVHEVVLGAVSAANAKVASLMGEKLPDGSVIVESKNRNQVMEVKDGNVAIKERPLVDPQALWDKYSQGVLNDRPIQRTLAVAQNALKDGVTKASVKEMLTADPHYKKIQQSSGTQKAQEHLRTMFRSAASRVEKPQQGQSTQQQHKQYSRLRQ